MYPKPKERGGRLIRRMIQFLRSQGVDLPINSHILIAASGGPDSTALAVLIARYGRKIIDPSRIRLFYVDHGWRLQEAGRERMKLERLARKLGVAFSSCAVPGPKAYPKGESWEAEARRLRLRALDQEAERWGGGACRVLTGHTQDDLAETVFWRLMTGAPPVQRGGILVQHGRFLRPLLSASKRDLIGFLKEEGVRASQDKTNRDPRFLRSRLRRSVWPELLRLFPRANEHLAQFGFDAQAG